MKILVTGGAGFIGTNLIKRLLEEGHSVESLDNYDTGTQNNHVEDCNYHSGDIESIHLMDKDFDLIYHLAALSRIQPSFKIPGETFRVNTEGTLAVCEFARKIGAKSIYIDKNGNKVSGEEYYKNNPDKNKKFVNFLFL